MTVNKHNPDLIQGRMILTSLKTSTAKIPSLPYFTTLSALLSQFISMYENVLNSQIEITPETLPCAGRINSNPDASLPLDPCATNAQGRPDRYIIKATPCPEESAVSRVGLMNDSFDTSILKSSVVIYLVTYSDGSGTQYPNHWAIGQGVLTKNGILTHSHFNKSDFDDTNTLESSGGTVSETYSAFNSVISIRNYYEWIEIRGAYGTIILRTDLITGGPIGLYNTKPHLLDGVTYLTYPDYDPQVLGAPIEIAGQALNLTDTTEFRTVHGTVLKPGGESRALDSKWCDLTVTRVRYDPDSEFSVFAPSISPNTSIPIKEFYAIDNSGAIIDSPMISGDSGGGLFIFVDGEAQLAGVLQDLTYPDPVRKIRMWYAPIFEE